ncbi:MAG: hypothetical protein IKP95_05685 [Ruminococcus sp.]|nr:hypothetical protein [Ruminococcus sp.]
MNFNYTTGEHIQILVALLKANGIKRAVVSPGTQDVEFVASMQQDSFFELYSCVDERSAAYMACGIAADTNEPVVITCTEATASRNYLPGLTEAYHRKLPILAVTCLHGYALIGNLWPQVIDRSVAPSDAVKFRCDVSLINDKEDAWRTNLQLNEAILELTHRTCGPVHINLPSSPHYNLDVRKLPETRIIRRYSYKDVLPALPEGRTAVFLGVHKKWTKAETEAIDRFCASNDAVVFCDKTGDYDGKYAVYSALLSYQKKAYELFSGIETLIHIGEETADTFTMNRLKSVKRVWRVSEDGCLRDTFRKLSAVFEMDEKFFFEKYAQKAGSEKSESKYLKMYEKDRSELWADMPELPFSNFYVASRFFPRLPGNSVLHIGASNTIRAWTLFEEKNTVKVFSNCGCRGIDGCVSSSLGASFVNREIIYFCVVGDLTFFYDMNSLGNRFVGNNIRIILINNGNGSIFKHYVHPCYMKLGDENTEKYLSAAGHFGNKSAVLVKHYAEDLGFEYLTASNKEELEFAAERFLSVVLTEKPMLLEVFTSDDDERRAYSMLSQIKTDASSKAKSRMKNLAKRFLSPKAIKKVKKLMR